ncbi:MAG: hypothetical protein LBD11_01815 [Candidatus Peribacteria bacterium]|jgi:hypothetical protein|nr:hypothetical protein [Candidatus Peribacteria bacterium]
MRKKIFKKLIWLSFEGKQEKVILDFFPDSQHTPRRYLKGHVNHPLSGLLFIYEDDKETLVGSVETILTGKEAPGAFKPEEVVFEVLRQDLEEALQVLPSGWQIPRKEMCERVEKGGRLFLLEEINGIWIPSLSFDNTL